MRFPNPLAFRPLQVTLWTTIVYLGLLIPLIVIHETVPPAPRSPTPYEGIDLTEAWADLTKITRGYHPYNSKENDVVRAYLLKRIRSILDGNGAQWAVEGTATTPDSFSEGPSVVIFDDVISNISLVAASAGGTSMDQHKAAVGTYFEGSNIMVYIRGTDDEPGEWWKKPAEMLPDDKGGVLVNAHFDSVSSGYGATDDGVGVVTVLQLISYFTTPGRQPKHGIVALLNNGEEDFLWGARAFGQSPLLPFVHTFLNLEGAGAGGRAILFRTTDLEVTRAYAKSPHPFGSVVAADGFSLGLIRSQTDYVVLNDIFGQRGLDLAFYEPRSRYHTNQDDARHTSKASLWHMLSASIKTVENLANGMGDKFSGPRRDDDAHKVQNGKGTHGVWFDLWGTALAIFSLKTMFVWSLCLLIISPIFLGLLTWAIIRADKFYFWAVKVRVDDGITDEPVSLKGHYGFFRFPLAFIVSTGLVVGSAFLVRKVNPLIVYSSSYAVFAMMLSLYYFCFWMIMRGADAHRPSSLQRGFAIMWLFVITWVILVVVTVFENRFKIASGYPFVILQSGVFLAMVISLFELFRLPEKQDYAQWSQNVDQAREGLETRSDAVIAPSPSEVDHRHADADHEETGPVTETTPLIGEGNRDTSWEGTRQTFATGYRRSISSIIAGSGKDTKDVYGDEQPWSSKLPRSLWILQFILIAPMAIVLTGQLALFIMAATSGTGADGSSLLFPYAIIALFTILLILPITPFIHRVTFHVPVALLLIFVGTLIYSLVAFPFSAQSRYKVYFQQEVNLDTAESSISLGGLEDFVRPIIAELPSSSGKSVDCKPVPNRGSIVKCAYDGSDMLPNLGGGVFPNPAVANKTLAGLVSISSRRPDSTENRAVLEIDAVNTKACFLKFKQRVTSFAVEGSSPLDERFGEKRDVYMVKLWRRDWDKVWRVDVKWTDEPVEREGSEDLVGEKERHSDELKARSTTAKLEGDVICVWSDANVQGTIPAYDEALRYVPAWVAVSKAAEGLVEGRRAFVVE